MIRKIDCDLEGIISVVTENFILSALFMVDTGKNSHHVPTYGVKYSLHKPMSKIDNHITKIDDFSITVEEGRLYIQGKAANKFTLYGKIE